MSRIQKLLIVVLVLAAVEMVVLLLTPIRNQLIRLGIIESILLQIAIITYFTWGVKSIGKCLLGGFIVLIIFLVSTAKLYPPDADKYVAALKRYEHVPYVWGGETKKGIDCSGLIRMALFDVYLSDYKWGAALHIFFFDAAAKDLGRKYKNILTYKRSYPSIKEIPLAELKKGSIVVASDIHTFAYIGENQWIQASPTDYKVTIKDADEPDKYFRTAVELFTFNNQ
jgi:hypothetical protein